MNAHHPTARSRKNGIDRPWGYAQIGAWITYGVSIIQYIIFITPLLSACITSPIVSMLFYTSNLFVFFFASYTILINPIDIHLHQYRTINEIQQQHTSNNNNNNENGATPTNTSGGSKQNMKPIILRNPLYQPPLTLMVPDETKRKHMSFSDRLYYRTNAKQLQMYNNSSLCHQHHQQQQQQCHMNHHQQSQQQQFPPFLPNEPMKQCWICDASVAEHSMHCKFCNKCVYGFDHHCIWLNTCIGRANYESFFRTLQSLFIMEIIHLLSHLILVITFFQDDNELKDRISTIYGIAVYVPFAIWIFFLVFNCMALMLLGQLYIFHTMLQVRNLTTYEHIVQDYRNQRNITRRLNDMEAERAESIIRAQSQKDTTKVIQLKVGKFCRERGLPYFDIMRLPPEPEEPDPEAGFANIFGKNAEPDSVEADSEHNNNNNDSHHPYQDNNDADHNNYMNDYPNDAVEMTDYDNVDSIHDGENGDENDDDNNNTQSDKKSKNYSKGRGDKNDKTTYDVDESMRSNTTRSIRTGTSKNEFHDIMDDGEQQQQPPNYVELTMSGQNDYYTETEGAVVIDDSGDHDGTGGGEGNVAGGLDASTSQYYDDDEQEEDENEEDAVDGLFIDDPDDMSHKSGCSGRSYRSGRSGRSSKSGRTGSKLTERDLTAF